MPDTRDWQMETERRLSHVEEKTDGHESWLRELQTALTAGLKEQQEANTKTAVHLERMAAAQVAQDDRCKQHDPIIKDMAHWQWLRGGMWKLLGAGGLIGATLTGVAVWFVTQVLPHLGK